MKVPWSVTPRSHLEKLFQCCHPLEQRLPAHQGCTQGCTQLQLPRCWLWGCPQASSQAGEGGTAAPLHPWLRAEAEGLEPRERLLQYHGTQRSGSFPNVEPTLPSPSL